MRAWVLLVLSCSTLAGAADYGLVGHWPFDGSLADTSGHHRQAQGAAHYAAGKLGQALDCQGQTVDVPDHPDLRLAPGFSLDLWVYFDRTPTGYETIVQKDNEYLLRVDSPAEGGHFSFFIYLDGWEPRLHGPVPEGGKWYHLVARWTGFESILEVNGEPFKASRGGTPVGTKNPVRLGGATSRLDDVKLLNPVTTRWHELEALEAKTTGARSVATTFGAGSGWAGWSGVAGAQVAVAGDTLNAVVPDGNAALVRTGLDLDVTGRSCVSVDLEAPGCTEATLFFLTDRGRGWAALPVWGDGRTSLADLARVTEWQGHLKLLALTLPQGAKQAKLNGLWISSEPAGRPYLYCRSVAPRHAIVRSGRDEPVLAVVRNLGRKTSGVTATLTPPPGVEVIGDAVQRPGEVPFDGTSLVEWHVRAARPVTGACRIDLAAAGVAPRSTTLNLEFRAPAGLPPASYVPEPKPAQSKYLMLMHYCPLWKEGTHYGWEKIEPWPDRRPAIGWYDEGTPEVADWHIKMALEHGIQGFIYCWYRDGFNPQIQQSLGHAIHDGLLKSRFKDKFKFTIMWENGCGTGCKGPDDLLQNLMPFWIKNYFSQPSYLKIDNKPVLYIWVPRNVTRDLGGEEAVKATFAKLRAAARKVGFDGLYIVGCVDSVQPGMLQQMARETWDASSAYGVSSPTKLPPSRDTEGHTTLDYPTSILGQETVWQGKRAVGALPDWTTLMMGWDPRPWHGARTSTYVAPASPAAFKAACVRAKAFLDAGPGQGLDRRIMVFDNWCEFGEGHYLEPCAGFGFGYLDAIRDVFCNDPRPCQDIIPEDVGLPSPEKAYLARREVLGGFPERPRRVVDHLLGWWRFEEQDASLCPDRSACGFHGAKQDFVAAPGRVGQGFLCRGGSVSVAHHPLLFPSTGVTVECWLKTDVPHQSDRWVLNTVAAANSGYRLGLGDGHLVWQVPKTSWSHNLTAPAPLPLGQWVHVVATYDNQTMRLYQDGRLVGSLDRGGPLGRGEGGLTLGNFGPGHGKAFYQGVVDEVRLLDQALTADEVAARFKAAGAP